MLNNVVASIYFSGKVQKSNQRKIFPQVYVPYNNFSCGYAGYKTERLTMIQIVCVVMETRSYN